MNIVVFSHPERTRVVAVYFPVVNIDFRYFYCWVFFRCNFRHFAYNWVRSVEAYWPDLQRWRHFEFIFSFIMSTIYLYRLKRFQIWFDKIKFDDFFLMTVDLFFLHHQKIYTSPCLKSIIHVQHFFIILLKCKHIFFRTKIFTNIEVFFY